MVAINFTNKPCGRTIKPGYTKYLLNVKTEDSFVLPLLFNMVKRL